MQSLKTISAFGLPMLTWWIPSGRPRVPILRFCRKIVLMADKTAFNAADGAVEGIRCCFGRFDALLPWWIDAASRKPRHSAAAHSRPFRGRFGPWKRSWACGSPSTETAVLRRPRRGVRNEKIYKAGGIGASCGRSVGVATFCRPREAPVLCPCGSSLPFPFARKEAEFFCKRVKRSLFF